MFSKGNDVLYTECAVHTPGQLVAVIHHFITTTQSEGDDFCFFLFQIYLFSTANFAYASRKWRYSCATTASVVSRYLYGCRRLRCSPWPAVKLRLIKSAQRPGRERPAGACSTSRASPSCWLTRASWPGVARHCWGTFLNNSQMKNGVFASQFSV